MDNRTRTNVFIETIDRIQLIKTTDVRYKDTVALDTGNTTLFIDETPLEIKVGSNKVKVSMLDFMQAFKDMLDTGVFELDQIDSEVWDIENKLEVLGNQNDYLNETLREIRGGF